MKVNRIFNSLSGEGPSAGVPMTFLRLQGCNQTCIWCDTKETWNNNGTEMSVDEIVSILPTDRPVYITGGEPLLQEKELHALVSKLRTVITVATNGTLPRPSWWRKVLWDVDYKCPSSGVNTFDDSWRTVGLKNNLKFVVSNPIDLNFVLDKVEGLRSALCPTLVMSPMLPPGPISENRQGWLQNVWDFCVQYNLRFSLQSHKVVHGDRRGV